LGALGVADLHVQARTVLLAGVRLRGNRELRFEWKFTAAPNLEARGHLCARALCRGHRPGEGHRVAVRRVEREPRTIQGYIHPAHSERYPVQDRGEWVGHIR